MRLVSSAGYIATSFSSLAPLALVRAKSIQDAVAALHDTENPCVVAGGTDLPAKFNEGCAPDTLIDISRIAELRDITRTAGSLSIGSLVTHADGSAHPLVRELLPEFAAAWSRIANVRVRFSATLGGNLMARRTRYEGSILLSALGATARLRLKSGESEIPVEALWSLSEPSALLTAIVIPLRAGQHFHYDRSLRPILTQAVAWDASGDGRVVTATEYAIPAIRSMHGGKVEERLRIGDPVTSEEYLARISDVFLRRQCQGLAS